MPERNINSQGNKLKDSTKRLKEIQEMLSTFSKKRELIHFSTAGKWTTLDHADQVGNQVLKNNCNDHNICVHE